MKKLIFALFCFYSLLFPALAQQIQVSDQKQLLNYEDSLKKLAPVILQSTDYNQRRKADSTFTKVLVRALKTKNSFFYPFDSLHTISHLYAPDSSFRIFTWQILIDEDNFRHKGAIQKKTKDGRLELISLIDQSDFIDRAEDTILNSKNWLGAICYRIIKTSIDTMNYYTLIEFDENNSQTNKKILEVMYFSNGEPIFGGNFFKVGINDSVTYPARFIMEYKAGAGSKLNYDQELKMIVKEHLVSENNEPDNKSTLVGDGDYEGFAWYKGKWIYQAKIFDQVTPNGEVPVPNPIKEKIEIID